MDRLKPCPFCGEQKFVEVRVNERNDRLECKFKAYAICLMCGAQTMNQGFDWTEGEAEENAVRAWNRRTGHT